MWDITYHFCECNLRAWSGRFFSFLGSIDSPQGPFFCWFQHAQAGEVAVVDDSVQFHPVLGTQQTDQIVDDIPGNDLPGYEHGDAWGVGDDLVGADPGKQPPPDMVLFVDKGDEFSAAIKSVARQIAKSGEAGNLGKAVQAPRRAAFAGDAHERVVQA